MENQISQPKKLSKLALASFICIIFGFFITFFCMMLKNPTRFVSENYGRIICHLGLILLFLSPFLGIWAEAQIFKNREQLKGEWLAGISVILSIGFWIFYLLLLMSL